MVLEKILRSSVAQFEFSCRPTYLAHGHDVQQNVDLTFLFNVYKRFFYFATFLIFV